MLIAGIENDFERVFMENICKRFYGEMRKKAFSMVFNKNDAEEIVQESFVRLIDNIETVMSVDKDKLPAYLMAAVRNTALNFIERKKNEQKHVLYSDKSDDILEQLPDDSEIPELLFLRKEEREVAAKALPLLQERDFLLLEAKYVLDIPNEELAKQFKISPNSIRTYIMRARKRAYALYLREEKRHG